MIIHNDCRHFRGDSPCTPHKKYGLHCNKCKHYDRIQFKLLIIKLDAVGDVLRTTCILPGLKERYPNSHITWLTMPSSFPLFENNGFVDTVLDCSTTSFLQIQSEHYDLVINTDAMPKSAIIAESVQAAKKLGFGYHQKGYVYPVNTEAQKWFEMGLFDDVKKSNTDTYQKIILAMTNSTSHNYKLILNLSENEKRFSNGFAAKNKIDTETLTIGINTGAGGRWKLKKWTIEALSKLIEMLSKNFPNTDILLYGGPEEVDRNAFLKNRHRNVVIDTGCDNSLRNFISLIDICDLFVTGDTMALHAAVALNKKVVALFGPTSHTEIDLYGRGKKVYPEIECLCCYKKSCDITPSCMDKITPDMVLSAIKELL